ncbi:MAG: tetratricopeptide repeat protein [Longimicrobiales bacterium]|nr:tetratricopeptide repeat protein [Longimicrobiales bacterium]
MSPFQRLIRELHRRSLWQVLGIYLVGSWIALQVVNELAQAASLPGWFAAFALGLLVLGLPIVLATAFVQEGLPGTESAPRPESDPRRDDPATTTAPGSAPASKVFTWRNAISGGVGALAVWGVLATGWILLDARAPAAPVSPIGADPSPSLAVLPLTNLSSDPENAFFAGGIHDELLTQLSRIPGLKVISRTTMLRYEGSGKSVGEIARELGVGAVMEGSVQRVGDRVRITAQLIDAATDAHLWAQSYDREITDIFAVQSEVALAVASALRTALTPKQAEALARRPTENAEAYALYLRGVDFLGRGSREEDLRTAARMLQRAVELDPRFAEAWAGLSRALIYLYWFGFDPTAARLEEGRKAAARAYELAPELPVARHAMANAHYRSREYDKALEFAEPLVAELPDFTLAVDVAAIIYRRLGRWDDALRLFERNVELDPASAARLGTLAHTYMALHRFPEAEAMLLRAIEVAADDSEGWCVALGALYLEWRGDLKAARDAVARIPDRDAAQRALGLAWYDAAEGRHQEGLDRLSGVPADVRMRENRGIGVDAAPTALLEAWLLERLGRAAEARARYRVAADDLEAIVEAPGFDTSGTVSYLSALALAYAGLGLKDRAIATVERSARALPVSLDALHGPTRLLDRAKIYATVGERDQAVAALEQALSTPIADTPASLRLDPLLASLRGYPPFERLMREKESR